LLQFISKNYFKKKSPVLGLAYRTTNTTSKKRKADGLYEILSLEEATESV
jgi:hypothetical protein